MNKLSLLFVAILFSVSLMGCDACKDNVFDSIGNTFATIGNDGLEKDRILAERKVGKAAKCAEQKAAEMKKKIGL